MIVQCEQCRTKFRLADERLAGGRGVKVRCSKCAHVFTVYGADGGKGASAAMSLPSMPPPPPLGAAGGARASALPSSPRLSIPLGPAPSVPPLDRPMQSGDLMAAIDDLMIPGGSAPMSALGAAAADGLDLGPAPSASPFGGVPSGLHVAGPGPQLPSAGWLGGGADPFAGVPPMPLGGAPPMGAMGARPPGFGMAFLDAHGELMPPSPGPPPGMPSLEPGLSFKSAPPPPLSAPPDPLAAASEALRMGEIPRFPAELDSGRPPSLEPPPRPSIDFLPQPDASLPPPPPRPSIDLGRPSSIDLSKPPSFGPPPRQSWSLKFDLTSTPPGPGKSVPPQQSIKAPTFPPPPVFDPFLDAPKSLAPPGAAPPKVQESEARTDQFILGNHAGGDDPFAGLSAAYPSSEQSVDVDLSEGESQKPPEKQALAKLELKKGLMGAAGVLTFNTSANEATTRHAPEWTPEAPVEDVQPKKRANARTFVLLAVLIALGGLAVATQRQNPQTRVGGIPVFESPSLVPGSIRSIVAQQARVSAYPLRSSSPHLVVSGVAVNEGETLNQPIEVVALIMDGDRIVEQRHAPLGALLPLDALAKASTAEEVDKAWDEAPRAGAQFVTDEVRPFMVVFPSIPDGVKKYSFVLEFRGVQGAAR